MLRAREAPVSATPSPDGADRTVPVPGSLSEIDQTWLLGVGQFGLSRSSDCLKRTMDVDGAAIGLIVLGPPLLMLTITVRLDSRGPVLFAQSRIGRRGQRFSMLKFRSMVDGADQVKHTLREFNEAQGGLFKISANRRIARVGRFLRRTSLDELPQLLNVLQGGDEPGRSASAGAGRGCADRGLAASATGGQTGDYGLVADLPLLTHPDAGDGEDRLHVRGQLVALAGPEDPAQNDPLHAGAAWTVMRAGPTAGIAQRDDPLEALRSPPLRRGARQMLVRQGSPVGLRKPWDGGMRVAGCSAQFSLPLASPSAQLGRGYHGGRNANHPQDQDFGKHFSADSPVRESVLHSFHRKANAQTSGGWSRVEHLPKST